MEKRTTSNYAEDVHEPPDCFCRQATAGNGVKEVGEADERESGQMSGGMMTFEGHLAELRRTIIHSLLITFVSACVILAGKEYVFRIVFAPSKSDFVLYRWINSIIDALGLTSMRLEDFSVRIINTELSSQFMTHISVSFYFGLLATSPYIVYRLFCFVRPALYENERHYSIVVVSAIYALFTLGLLMNYFVIFPVSFRFLGTYQVDESVVNTITLSSYISSFTLLSLTMGLVFEVPILVFALGKMGIITAQMLASCRRIAFVVIMTVAAFITPPDVFTLVLMTIPLYCLYEFGIWILKRLNREMDKLDK